ESQPHVQHSSGKPRRTYLYLASIHGITAGQPPSVDFDLERKVQAACRTGIHQGWVRSAHDCAEGGVAIALAEACISGQKGADITLMLSPKQIEAESFRWDEILFGEGGARIVVSISPDQAITWEAYLQQNLGNYWQKIGQVSGSDSLLNISLSNDLSLIRADVKTMSDRWNHSIESHLAV
ncbi:MAG: hypothetical protein F6K19_01040, partial [Cyanothece sp. SIO1E1]|nr:hypothetical protein [Cyanothece sp. SIO1E1]